MSTAESRPQAYTPSDHDDAGIYAAPRTVTDLDDCWFYHSMTLPRHGEVVGHWDLRPGIDDYLGRYDYRNKRVLEIGPASGYVTVELERRGAEVVGIEMASESDYDLLPAGYADAPSLDDHRVSLRSLTNGYWLVHAALGSTAKVHYGDVRNLPPEIGQFDVCFIGSVLLHSHDPLGVILSCAERTTTAMVIADVRSVVEDAPDRRGEPVAVFFPTVANRVVNRWWTFSPELFTAFLATLGFVRTSVILHEQHYVGSGIMHPMFTVVAER
jgi:SAM-dependent methyltransferase